MVAYPICPGYTVSGAEIYADDDDFTTLWKAHGARSAETEQGLFEVGGDAGFAEEEQPLRGELPDGFYVAVVEKTGGTEEDGRDGWIDLSRLKRPAGEGRVHDLHGEGDDPGGRQRPAELLLSEVPVTGPAPHSRSAQVLQRWWPW